MSSRAPLGALSASEVARAGVKRSDIAVANGSVYWLERRPQEQGRSVIVRSHLQSSGSGLRGSGKIDVVSQERNVRSIAHEYGGACFVVLAHTGAEPTERIVFADHATRSIVVAQGSINDSAIALEESPLLVDAHSAYADFIADTERNRIICVREHYPSAADGQGAQEPIASIVALSLHGQQDQASTLIDSRTTGHDFVTTPRLSPDGSRLAWVAWSHPNMPWDSSELWVADVGAQGDCSNVRQLAGGDGVSIFQPEFSPNGTLHFVSDASGWWNIYRFDSDELSAKNLTPISYEFAQPQWVFGMSTYAIPRDDLLVAIGSSAGTWHLGWLDPTVDNPEWLQTNASEDHQPLTWFDSVAANAHHVALLAAGPKTLPQVLAWSTEKRGFNNPQAAAAVLEAPSFEALEQASISVGSAIAFTSPHPNGPMLSATTKARTCHAFYYPPGPSTNADGCAPPLIVKSHGGPTGATDNALDPAIQYWTSRGFAVADVNYGGSTGYGSDYRHSLDGQWGIIDVEDCAAAALFLVDQGLADRDRLIIRGGSAGGYTTLAALAFTDTFCAGASLYGIGDLETLASDTHKFESRYMERMIGPYPQERELYHKRSPIHRADQLSCPVIFFQGSEDKVVPPNQSEAMFEALKAKGVATEYVLFEGEGHGFRRAENIITALEREFEFYQENL